MTTTQSTPPTARYTIDIKPFYILHQFDDCAVDMCIDELDVLAQEIAARFGKRFNPWKFEIRQYANQNRFMVVRHFSSKGKTIVGVMLSSLYRSAFDHLVKIQHQDLLYVRPGHPRATKMLMDDFIDFGKRNANHLISMIGPATNIKPRSLERLGFKVMETTYRLEV